MIVISTFLKHCLKLSAGQQRIHERNDEPASDGLGYQQAIVLKFAHTAAEFMPKTTIDLGWLARLAAAVVDKGCNYHNLP